MDIIILKTFLEVYRTCHFGKAADNLFVTQSTVSARIRQLEDELGVQLFNRDRNNIQLTQPGRKFLRHAESILNVWNRAHLDINIREEGKLPLIIGAIPSLWDIYLIDWLAKVKKKYPKTSIVTEALSTDSLFRQLLDRSIDIGFTYEFPQLAELTIRESLVFELILVSTQTEQTPEKALDSNYVFVDWGTSFSNEHTRNFPDISPPELKFDLGHIAREFILKCGGSAYLPEPMVKKDLLEKRLHLVKNAPGINRKLFVAYRNDSDRKDFVERLISLNDRKR
jgi:LysR family transcriptional regulator, flagellar master operon regulator